MSTTVFLIILRVGHDQRLDILWLKLYLSFFFLFQLMNTIIVKGKHTVRFIGCAIAKSVRHWLLTTKPRVQFLVTACEIRCGRNVTAADVSLSLIAFPLPIIIPQLLHTHLSPPSSRCVSSDQAAHYHIHGLLSLGLHL
jgi:hypothetical protein